MTESSINVCVRIRPFSEKEASHLAPNEDHTPFLGDGGLAGGISPNKLPPSAVASTSTLKTRFVRPIVKPMDQKVLVFDPPDTNPLTRLYSSGPLAHGARRNKDVRYAFDRVFDSTASQTDVFRETCSPLLDGILNGYNASVFAYGATGCGKTHTISGTPEDPGLIFLTMKELYARIQDARDDSDVQIRLSYLEIYNETIRDLLSSEPTPPGAGLALREDANNRISVVGITELIPESPESVLQYLQEGNLRRTMSPTEANAVSSRSHAVLQINVTQKPRTASMTEQTTSASLNIIDLAGSERASATRNNGARMKEGANINKSLLALGNCINALCQSGGVVKHVPYRNSKLTRLLKFSLGGNCKTVMVVCISPSSAHYEETHNALKYANQAKNIRTKVSRNMINVDRHVAQYVQAIHELKEENERLRAKLDERGTLESAAEKRKRAEMGREVDEAKKRMRESTDNVTRLVTDKAGFEATTAAAETKLAELRKRLAVVEADLQRFSSKNEVLPSDLEGERDVLRKMVAAEEAALKDETTCAGVRSLLNSLQMQRGIIVAASHNQKFDAEASETVQTLGNAMLAEVEAEKAKVKFTGLLDALRRSTTESTQLVSAATRSTIALREVAGELEYRATATNETASSEGTAEISSTLTLLASQLRSIAGENEKIFEAMCGAALPVAAPLPAFTAAPSTASTAAVRTTKPAISSALRRSPATAPASSASSATSSSAAPVGSTRSVSSSATGFSRATAASSRRASIAPPLARSTSMQVASSPSTLQPSNILNTSTSRPSFAAPTSSSSARSQVTTSSPARKTAATRRVSTAGATRRLSLVRSSRPVAVALPVVEEKKKFRWADEAGEGSIDDKGLAHGPAAEDSATTGDSAGSSSGAEWEDVSDGRTTPAQLVKPATSVAAKPISRSTSLGTASRGLSAFPETKRSVSSTSTLSPLREASGTSADEADISNASPVAPLRPLNPRPPLRATTNTAASAPAARLLNGSSFPVFPATVDTDGAVPVKKAFPRPSAGGPGPIRRRTRTSVAVIGQANPLLTLGAGGGTIPGQSVNSGVGNRVKASRVSSVPGMRSATVTGGSMFA
ncbi:Kinesin, motor domain protein [Kalmanozyma brasiliensis GHG001]|uniref:Kinesin, motor domain protein n=1 Tax=Kalmanozyma brasiliensis (strain GHG001) TaxID=1365824 RepID=UPI0028681A49|nr:Kinesin, motor domain protein [Kalmanozyma brasiliensis GHG001]EST07537.2 Kinesin, motor domain protein [Kalmanozyma brasiliensis GHG001]